MAEQLRHELDHHAPAGTDGSRGSERVITSGTPRARFLRDGLLAGASVVAGASAGALVGEEASGARTARGDRRVLRFLLQLEYLQADFYSAASDTGSLTGELQEFAEVVGAHEREHVALLERRLGNDAGRKPRFDFGSSVRNADEFARAARELEETGCAAYIGQGANLTPRSVAVVSRITAVEARHAAWIADFLGRDPAPRAADRAQTSSQVLASIRRTGFLR
jgi:hypothetical protein